MHSNFKKCKNHPPLMPHDLHTFRFLITFSLMLYIVGKANLVRDIPKIRVLG
jgi:hypothetical protein